MRANPVFFIIPAKTFPFMLFAYDTCMSHASDLWKLYTFGFIEELLKMALKEKLQDEERIVEAFGAYSEKYLEF